MYRMKRGTPKKFWNIEHKKCGAKMDTKITKRKMTFGSCTIKITNIPVLWK